MLRLMRPEVQFDDHYRLCVGGKKEPAKGNLLNCLPVLLEAVRNYLACAESRRLSEVTKLASERLSPVTSEDLVDLYKNRMTKSRSPGRSLYNKIMVGAAGRCPYCAHNQPRTLDHFLPQARFPEFSLHPQNLVPCCRDCNSAKGEDTPILNEDQYIHPYFDDVSMYNWLLCRVSFQRGGSPVFIYSVNAGIEDIDVIIYKRILKQFDSLKLSELYSVEAGSELSGRFPGFKEVYDLTGSEGLRTDLLREANSRMRINPNSWQSALYLAMANDERFCGMQWTF